MIVNLPEVSVRLLPLNIQVKVTIREEDMSQVRVRGVPSLTVGLGGVTVMGGGSVSIDKGINNI